MGWDQSTSRESVEYFLLRHFGTDLDSLVQEAIQAMLDENDLTFEVHEDTSRHEGDGLVSEFHPKVVRFSDGRVFSEAMTEEQRSDDWGHDHYTFVEVGKDYDVSHEDVLFEEGDSSCCPSCGRDTVDPQNEVIQAGGAYCPNCNWIGTAEDTVPHLRVTTTKANISFDAVQEVDPRSHPGVDLFKGRSGRWHAECKAGCFHGETPEVALSAANEALRS